MSNFLTPEEIAERLKIHPGTVREWLRQSKLKGIKVGKLWRVEEEEFKRFLKEGKR